MWLICGTVFKDLTSLAKLCGAKLPSPKKVCRLFEAKPVDDGERECFDHFKRFVQSLEDNLLNCLLQFVTGTNILSIHKIQVAFTADEGAMRCPRQHTCAPLLVILSP